MKKSDESQMNRCYQMAEQIWELLTTSLPKLSVIEMLGILTLVIHKLYNDLEREIRQEVLNRNLQTQLLQTMKDENMPKA